MAISKDAKGMGMPWEAEYGYAQAVKVGDTIYVSGQVSHDDEGTSLEQPRWTTKVGYGITRTWRSR